MILFVKSNNACSTDPILPRAYSKYSSSFLSFDSNPGSLRSSVTWFSQRFNILSPLTSCLVRLSSCTLLSALAFIRPAHGLMPKAFAAPLSYLDLCLYYSLLLLSIKVAPPARCSSHYFIVPLLSDIPDLWFLVSLLPRMNILWGHSHCLCTAVSPLAIKVPGIK